MRIDERGLPPTLRYINRRLTGQPLVTAIWLVYMLSVSAAVYALDSARGTMGNFIMCWILAFDLIVVFALLSMAVRKEGRRWLLAKYDEDVGVSVSTASRSIIRFLPFLGLIVLAEYVFLR